MLQIQGKQTVAADLKTDHLLLTFPDFIKKTLCTNQQGLVVRGFKGFIMG